MRNFVVLLSVSFSMGPLLGGQELSGLDRRLREGQDALYRLDYAQAEGNLDWNDEKVGSRVGEMLALVGATTEYQFG